MLQFEANHIIVMIPKWLKVHIRKESKQYSISDYGALCRRFTKKKNYGEDCKCLNYLKLYENFFEMENEKICKETEKK